MHARNKAGTFSIVAFDPSNGDLGIAVQSRFIAVGSVVPWLKATVGAIATQAWANVSYGPKGLELLESVKSAKKVLATLVESDEKREVRQVGIVDGRGEVAAFTGKECMAWAGHVVGQHYCCLGNILVGKETVEEMANAFEVTKGDLIEKLLASLEAGQVAGGDRRGQQAAALVVARKSGGYEGFTDRYVDLRVDDHPSPIAELKRIFRIYDMAMLTREPASNLLNMEGKLLMEIQALLQRPGQYTGPVNDVLTPEFRESLKKYLLMNNFENKMRDDDMIWLSVVNYMRETLSQ